MKLNLGRLETQDQIIEALRTIERLFNGIDGKGQVTLSDGTVLTVDTIADGQTLKRSGNKIVGV